MERKAIALAGNYQYLPKLETTIKSILYNNVNLRIYILNSDIPQEWFRGKNRDFMPLGSQIIDKKIDPGLLKDEYNVWGKTDNMTYALFFIPDMIPDDRVLYLDGDVIVNHDLSDLFNLKFKPGMLMAGVPEIGGDPNIINTGSLLMDNRALKAIDNLTTTLLDMGKNPHITNNDETVINDYFAGKIQHISMTYNYQIGFELQASISQRTDILTTLDSIPDPVIIHYASQDKPWNITSSNRYRDKWWQYNALDWGKIRQKIRTRTDIMPLKRQRNVGDAFVITALQNIAHIEELIQSLPEWTIHIAAYSWMGFGLIHFLSYPNVRLHTNLTGFMLNKLINDCAVYLDINYGNNDIQSVKRFLATGKPVLTFEDAKSLDIQSDQYKVYGKNDQQAMIEFLHHYRPAK